MVNNYTLMQLPVWWLCHAVAIYWKIRFPLRARLFTLNKKDKYVHLCCLIAGLVLPLVTIIVPIADTAIHFESNSTSLASSGFGFGQSITGCFGWTKAARYSLSVCTSFTFSLAITLFILICFSIHKVATYV